MKYLEKAKGFRVQSGYFALHFAPQPILPRAGFHSAFISDSLLTAQGGVTDVFLSEGRFSKGEGLAPNKRVKGCRCLTRNNQRCVFYHL